MLTSFQLCIDVHIFFVGSSHAYKRDSVMRFFASGFFDESISPKPQSIPLGPVLKTCLEEFGTFSGLKCNIEKTVLMQVGQKTPITPEIAALGFSFVDSIKILGMDIDAEIENLDANFVRIATSID
jgi:hypothetical protein